MTRRSRVGPRAARALGLLIIFLVKIGETIGGMGTLEASGNRSTQVVVAERNMVEAGRTWRRRKEREEGGHKC